MSVPAVGATYLRRQLGRTAAGSLRSRKLHLITMDNKSVVTKKVTATILSMSLLTVMAGAAVAPALGIIRQHFADAPDLQVQLIVSLPALFIIVTNLCFRSISRHLGSRTIALVGLVLYVAAGGGCFFLDNINVILVMRALLGVSVGLIMPLSTGLLSYYFPPEEQARMMGLSAAMNQMGGVVGTLLAGLLASVEWNYAFLVYVLALVALLMVFLWLPNEHLAAPGDRKEPVKAKQLLRFHPSVIGMFLLTVVFFIFPTNFAIIESSKLGLAASVITLIMVALDLVAFFAGLVFGGLMARFSRQLKYVPPVLLIVGFLLYAFPGNVAAVLVGSALIGTANGFGVPYMLTIGSLKAGKDAATTVMPLLSAALYLGQFISPLLVMPMAKGIFGEADITGPYKVAVAISVLYLVQAWATRRFQCLPDSKN